MNGDPLHHLSRKFHISIAGALTAALLSISIRALVSGLRVPVGILVIKFVNFLLIRKFHLELFPLTVPNDIFWPIPIANIAAGVALVAVSIGLGITFVKSSSIEH
jgi:hypothetical protein